MTNDDKKENDEKILEIPDKNLSNYIVVIVKKIDTNNY